MSDDSATIQLSTPRLVLLLTAQAMIPAAVVLSAAGFGLREWPFLAAAAVMCAIFVLLVAAFTRISFRLRISKAGLECSFFMFRDVARWDDIERLRVAWPCAFFGIGGVFRSIFQPRFISLPRFWLVKEPGKYGEAVELYAPDGHVVKRVLLGNEKPVLREVLTFILGVAAMAAFVAYTEYERPDPLHDALVAGKLREVQELVQARPELVDERDRFGRTPLHWAAQEGHAEIAECLIGAGAGIDVKDKPPLGCTPLHVAVGCGQENVVKVLLDSGASLDVRDEQGRTPLDTAIQNGREEIAEMLRQHRARQE